jgi:hypothetical protein
VQLLVIAPSVAPAPQRSSGTGSSSATAKAAPGRRRPKVGLPSWGWRPASAAAAAGRSRLSDGRTAAGIASGGDFVLYLPTVAHITVSRRSALEPPADAQSTAIARKPLHEKFGWQFWQRNDRTPAKSRGWIDRLRGCGRLTVVGTCRRVPVDSIVGIRQIGD